MKKERLSPHIPNIAFDIDGVVLDFAGCFLRVAKEKFGLLKDAKLYDIIRYQFYECLDISFETTFEIVEYIIKNPIESKMETVPGAVKTLTQLSKYIPLTFVTARKEYAIEATKKSIYSMFPKLDKSKIKIVHIQSSKKYLALNELNIKYFVDDRTSNCRILNANGIESFLFDSPWNQTKEPFNRVKTWGELRNILITKD